MNPELTKSANCISTIDLYPPTLSPGGLNQFGNLSDGYGGIAFADINGDGYDDILLHPVYSEGSATNFSLYKVKFELYLYENGEFKFHEMDFGSFPDAEEVVR